MADRENNSVVMLAAAQQITCFKPFFRIDDFLKSLWFCVVLADLLHTHPIPVLHKQDNSETLINYVIWGQKRGHGK